MIRALLCAVVVVSLASAAEPIAYGPDDWPWWRGPNYDGHASPKQKPPTQWSASERIIWKAPIPGKGHGSASVVGESVFIATADSATETQSVICLNRATGAQRWQTVVHKGPFEKKGNSKNSHASCTPACDGKLVFVNFLNSGFVHATALDLDGKIVWQTKICDYVMHQGFGASPAPYKDLVLIAVDHKGGGAIAGLDRATGKIVWKIDRPKVPNYSSPIVMSLGGRDQLVMTGCDLVTGIDPLSGKVLWETKGSTTECVTSTVTDGTHVFTSGGYPKNHISAVKADGSGKIAWEIGARVYVPSMFVKEGHLFGVLDAGVATCWNAATGKEVWSGRLGGGFSSSPVPVGDLVYATNETGKTFVYKASTKGLDIVAENQLGNEVFATPTICGGRIYHRVAINDKSSRTEWLYCIGER